MYRRFLVSCASYVTALTVTVGPLYASSDVFQSNLLSVVVTARQDYPTPMSEEQIGELVARVARIGGPDWGVLLKADGSRCPSPVGFISCDILVHIPTEQEYDILADAEGAGTPTFQKLGFKCGQPPSGCEMSRVRRVTVDPVPTPTPDPVPPPDLALILERLVVLERHISTLLDEDLNLRESIAAESKAIRALIAALPPAQIKCSDLPLYRGSAWFGSVTSKPQCK